MEKITILVVDDHTLIRQTWSMIFNSNPAFSVVDEAGSAEEGIELVKSLRPFLVGYGHQPTGHERH